ncbi:hypothetical protein Agabi119p4_8490 [Agaricus bisporus var. burnettii]|uniref:Uncharacterized protein n=1 Tax=Agaricus bisporus var. burnettii TaxID=192524 RepID=A0A8H7C5X1_AGABI|nr:hypothetical protein Agabi119p4_8490 [Agaricus bisporus var. burnettii]
MEHNNDASVFPDHSAPGNQQEMQNQFSPLQFSLSLPAPSGLQEMPNQSLQVQHSLSLSPQTSPTFQITPPSDQVMPHGPSTLSMATTQQMLPLGIADLFQQQINMQQQHMQTIQQQHSIERQQYQQFQLQMASEIRHLC